MIHILQSVSNMDRGGIETVLMNVYRHLDRSCFQFAFLVNKPKPGFYDDEIRALGGRIWVSPGLSPAKYPAYMRFMAQLLKDQPQIQALHAHNGAMAYYALRGAQKANLPVRIAHAHNSHLPRDYKLPLNLACKALIPSAATDYWACGRDAGLYSFGQKRWEREGVIMHNAVDLRRCGFQADKRAALRAQYGLQDRPGDRLRGPVYAPEKSPAHAANLCTIAGHPASKQSGADWRRPPDGKLPSAGPAAGHCGQCAVSGGAGRPVRLVSGHGRAADALPVRGPAHGGHRGPGGGTKTTHPQGRPLCRRPWWAAAVRSRANGCFPNSPLTFL